MAIQGETRIAMKMNDAALLTQAIVGDSWWESKRDSLGGDRKLSGKENGSGRGRERGRGVGGEVGVTMKQKQGNQERSRPIGSHLKNR